MEGQKGTSRRRLTLEAYAILNGTRSTLWKDTKSHPNTQSVCYRDAPGPSVPCPDYFINISKWPDPDAQEELAERVRRVPGCGFYTARQVYSYFANSRVKVRASGKDAVLTTGEHARRGRPKKGE